MHLLLVNWMHSSQFKEKNIRHMKNRLIKKKKKKKIKLEQQQTYAFI